MVELDQIKYNLSQYDTPMKDLKSALDFESKKKQIAELSMYMEDPNFWNDAEKSSKITKQLKNLQDTVKEYDALEQQFEDILTLIDMGNEENDPSMVEEVQAEFADFKDKFEVLHTATLLSDQFDELLDLCIKLCVKLIIVNMIMIIFVSIQCSVLPAGKEAPVLMAEIRNLFIAKQ